MIKILATALFLVTSALGVFFVLYMQTKRELIHEQYYNAVLSEKLDSQNKAIEKLKLDTQSYKEQKETQKSHIQEKYKQAKAKVIYIPSKECKLEEYNRLQKQEKELQELLETRYKKG